MSIVAIFLIVFIMLYISEYSGSGGMNMVMLDDCNFHESVRLDDFDLERTLTLVRSINMSVIYCNHNKLYRFTHFHFLGT